MISRCKCSAYLPPQHLHLQEQYTYHIHNLTTLLTPLIPLYTAFSLCAPLNMHAFKTKSNKVQATHTPEATSTTNQTYTAQIRLHYTMCSTSWTHYNLPPCLFAWRKQLMCVLLTWEPVFIKHWVLTGSLGWLVAWVASGRHSFCSNKGPLSSFIQQNTKRKLVLVVKLSTVVIGGWMEGAVRAT